MQSTSSGDSRKVVRNCKARVFGVAMFVVALGLLTPSASAQEVQPYEYARPGQPTMTIYVWGAVSKPGIWVMEQEATLVEVLSLVNAQVDVNTREGTSVTRLLRIYRGSEESGEASTERDLIYEMPLEDVLLAPHPELTLRDNDVLSIDVEVRRTWLTLRNISSVVGTAASIALLIIRLGEF